MEAVLFVYTHKHYFLSFIYNVTWLYRPHIPPHIVHNVAIKTGGNPSSNSIERALRILAKENRQYANYYDKVWQLRCEIRRKPNIDLDRDQIIKMTDLFDLLYQSWKKIEPKKINFMTNSQALFLCLIGIGIPMEEAIIFADGPVMMIPSELQMICNDIGVSWEDVSDVLCGVQSMY